MPGSDRGDAPLEAGRLHGLLDAARKTARRRAWAQAAAYVLGAFAFMALAAAIVAGAFDSPRAAATVSGLGAVIGFALAAITLWKVHAKASDVEVATWLDKTHPDGVETQDSLRSAIELERDHGRFGESAELSSVAIARARKNATDRKASEQLDAPARRWLMQLVTTGLIMWTTAAGVALIKPSWFKAGLGSFSRWGEVTEVLTPSLPEPRLGDVRLSYTYPAYTKQPPRTIVSPSGTIEALPGTEVVIEASTRRPLSRASLLVQEGDEEPKRMAVEVDGRRLRARLVVNRPGSYRFNVTTTDGEEREQRRGQTIEVELDDVPQVTLHEPKDTPLEVNASDRLEIEFSAEDDFALGESLVHWRVLGTAREGRARLTSASAGQKRYRGEAGLELASLQLRPGDHVAYTVEVRDNDTVSGPKVGSSETKELIIYSETAHHREVLAQAEKALDELVHILGDNLVASGLAAADATKYEPALKVAQKIVARAEEANELLRATVTAMQRDPVGKKDVAAAFEQARRHLQDDARRKGRALRSAVRTFNKRKQRNAMQARRIDDLRGRLVGRLEKNVVYLADLLNDQRLIDAQRLAKELRKEQQNLRQALQEYKNAPDDQRRAMIAQAIEQVKKRIGEIMGEMSRLQSTIPTDFVNQDAMDTQSQEQGMDEVKKKLEEGDLDAAMKALDDMLGQTEKMLASLEEGREELGSREYSEITERAKKVWKDLETLEAEERRLAQQTERWSKKLRERTSERMGDEGEFVKKQLERIKRAKAALQKNRPGRFMPEIESFELTERRLEDGARALEGKDFGAAKDVLEQADTQMSALKTEAERRAAQARRFGDVFDMKSRVQQTQKALQSAQPEVQAVLDDIDSLMPSPETLLSPEERKQMQKLADKQQQLAKKTEQVGKELDELGEMLPIVGPEVKENLQGAEDAMKEAQAGLGKGDAPSALGQERTALEKLSQLKDELQKMSEGKGGGSGGVPLPFGQPKGDGGGGGKEGGREQDPREKVEIPKPEQYQAPAAFREDILEAAKQGTPESYKDAVQRYYEEIVK